LVKTIKSFTFNVYVFVFVAMKTIVILSALCLSMLLTLPTKAQVVVTGHVSAEIVDAANIPSQISYSQFYTNSPDFASEMDLHSFVLGEITIQSGNRSAYQVVLTPATITGFEGESLVVETSFASLGNTTDQTLQLTSNVNTLYERGFGIYEGSYSFILAYD